MASCCALAAICCVEALDCSVEAETCCVEALEDSATAATEFMLSRIWSPLAAMPARQRAVVMLRDVDGLRGDEVCEVLALTPANERVLLHRGRSRLRQALEDRIGAAGAWAS